MTYINLDSPCQLDNDVLLRHKNSVFLNQIILGLIKFVEKSINIFWDNKCLRLSLYGIHVHLSVIISSENWVANKACIHVPFSTRKEKVNMSVGLAVGLKLEEKRQLREPQIKFNGSSTT